MFQDSYSFNRSVRHSKNQECKAVSGFLCRCHVPSETFYPTTPYLISVVSNINHGNKKWRRIDQMNVIPNSNHGIHGLVNDIPAFTKRLQNFSFVVKSVNLSPRPA